MFRVHVERVRKISSKGLAFVCIPIQGNIYFYFVENKRVPREYSIAENVHLYCARNDITSPWWVSLLGVSWAAPAAKGLNISMDGATECKRRAREQQQQQAMAVTLAVVVEVTERLLDCTGGTMSVCARAESSRPNGNWFRWKLNNIGLTQAEASIPFSRLVLHPASTPLRSHPALPFSLSPPAGWLQGTAKPMQPLAQLYGFSFCSTSVFWSRKPDFLSGRLYLDYTYWFGWVCWNLLRI